MRKFFLIVLGIAALSCLGVAAVKGMLGYVVLACGFALAAAMVWFTRLPTLHATLEDGGVALENGQRIADHEIQRVTFAGLATDPKWLGSKPGAIHLRTRSRWLLLKPDSDTTSSQLYSQLWDRCISSQQVQLPPNLKVFADQETQRFSEDQVLATASARAAPPTQIGAIHFLVPLIITIAAIAGGVLENREESFAVIATIAGIIAFVMLVLWPLTRFTRNRASQGVAMVMSPGGLALQMRDLKGKSAWKAIQQIELKPSPAKPKQLRIRMEGITIPLLDQFGVPLWYIYEFMMRSKANAESIELAQNRSFFDPAATSATSPPPTLDSSNPYQAPRTL